MILTDDNNEFKSPYVITICSGKGGVGKSVISANLANILSKDLSVLVWDADRYFPNQHLIFGVEPPVRLKNIYERKVSVKHGIYKINEGLYLLADEPAEERNLKFDTRVFLNIFCEISEMNKFDVVIIDTPAGVTNELIQACSFSDSIGLIITDEPTTLLDGYGLIKILMQYVPADKISLIVNNAIDFEDADEVMVKLNLATKKFLGFNLDLSGFIPYNRIVRQSIILQQLITELYLDSDVTKSIEEMSQNFAIKMKNNVLLNV